MTTLQSLEISAGIIINMMECQRGEKQLQLAKIHASIIDAIEAIQAKAIIIYMKGANR